MFNYGSKEEAISRENIEKMLKEIEVHDKSRADKYRAMILASTTEPVFIRDLCGDPWLKINVPMDEE